MRTIALEPILVKAMLQFRSWTSRSHQFSSHTFVINSRCGVFPYQFLQLPLNSDEICLAEEIKCTAIALSCKRSLRACSSSSIGCNDLASRYAHGIPSSSGRVLQRDPSISLSLYFLGLVSCDLPNKHYSLRSQTTVKSSSPSRVYNGRASGCQSCADFPNVRFLQGMLRVNAFLWFFLFFF